MVGIYKITNRINGKVYIGKSVHIKRRWAEHKSRSTISKNKSYPLYLAFIKYGINNFVFEIVEECEASMLDELEKKNIKKFNSMIGKEKSWGYNIRSGGAGGYLAGEQNVKSKLTEQEVYNIREMYFNLVPKMVAFETFRHKISINTFSDVWIGKTWKHIHFDVYTDEKKMSQRNNFNRKTQIDNNRKVSDNDVLKIRDLKNQGLTRGEVIKRFIETININTFNDIWYGRTFKEVKSSIEDKNEKFKRIQKQQTGIMNPCALFSEEDVSLIRKKKRNGEELMDVYRLFKEMATYSCFYNLWIGKTYKNIN